MEVYLRREKYGKRIGHLPTSTNTKSTISQWQHQSDIIDTTPPTVINANGRAIEGTIDTATATTNTSVVVVFVVEAGEERKYFVVTYFPKPRK